MAKKSNAQIKRLTQRAAARGDTYVPPEDEKDAHNDDDDRNDQNVPVKASPSTVSKNDDRDPTKGKETMSKEDKAKRNAANKLKKDLASIESDEGMKAKDRRSAKRKAEAIAVESSGCASVEELLQWHEIHGGNDDQPDQKRRKKQDDPGSSKPSNPYILFIGQLSYDTTKESLFLHFEKQLKDDDHHVTKENFKIRLLTDPKTKKSRGMAFVEVCDDPELLYSCLKLHHTHLEGRRINVERSAGGGKHSETRKAKLQQFREEQVKHMEDTVDAVLEDYHKRGEIREQGELDAGVILLCKRHSAAVVQASLERYVESNGRDMDNPSAYLTFLLGKLAEEGIYNDREKEEKNKRSSTTDTKRKAPGGKASSGKAYGGNASGGKASVGTASSITHDAKRLKKSNIAPSKFAHSEFAKQGIDMEMAGAAGDNAYAIFPSLARRGRGRGYM